MTHDGRFTTDDGRRTTPRVWHKLPTGELKSDSWKHYCYRCWETPQLDCCISNHQKQAFLNDKFITGSEPTSKE